MFNKTDMTKSNDAQNRAAFVSSQKVNDSIVQLPNKSDTVPVDGSPWNHFKRLGLGTKTTILAIAIGTIPVLGIGAIAYSLASKAMAKQITQAQTATAVELTEKINRLLWGRYEDIQLLSKMPFLANYKVSARTTNQEKKAVFNQMIETEKAYDSIAVFDVEGNLIVQSTGEPLDNQKDRNYFQQTLQKDAPVISKPEKSKNIDVASIYIAAPVKDPDTSKTLALVIARMPVTSLTEVIKNYTSNGQQYYLLDNSGTIFLSSQKALLGKEAKTEYPGLAQMLTAKKVNTFTTVQKTNQKRELVSYVPSQKLKGLPDLNWQLLLSTDTATLFAPQRQLLWTIAIATIITALITAAIAAWLAKRNTQPILNATEALTELGKGELNTRLETEREDELGVMSTNINQMAAQLQVLATEQDSQAEQQQTETLQQQLLELLNNVEGAARGDLTVRADVTTGEIGTVADFFNSIVESLRDIVTQVKQAATQVDGAIGSNEGAIRQLAEEALIQAAEIDRTLDAVDQMTHSMQTVADNAQKAAVVANHAAHTATKSGQAMDLTVQNILSLRETVGETTKKVKRLGESSQQISRVVSLINQIATQTNLLAINAGIEAARAGEEGQGFAVVAEEVGELAIRSAAATQEIAQIVDNIQRETSEVVQAMEIGTTQVVEGTRIVEEAKQSLSQILDVSRQIDSLAQSISTATASQVQTSQTISQLMQDIAAGSQRTSASSRLVSNSLQQTVEISHQLQETVEAFKVS
ncbi:methyl-accepting chemotaxis protein [Halotia wernerae UHCC 0503]|nr:methyl-accepting chemotaxis protein [Halotia wernerae UHCC 0503]